MGLFKLIKKMCGTSKKTVTFTSTVNTKSNYSPWQPTRQPRNDDYAIAAFISMSEKGAQVGKTNDDYARYFSYEYKVYDPMKYHKKVIAEGYLVEAEPTVALKKFKVNELKDILSRNGLPNKGKKEELINRILESVDLKSLNLPKYYGPSEKGKEHLKKYGYMFTLSSYGISFEEYEKHKKKHGSYLLPNDIIWQILNKRLLEHCSNSNYSLARCEEHYMAAFLKKEGKYTDALYHYIVVLYYDLSGCWNHGTVCKKSDLVIAPYLIEEIFSLKQYYNPEIINKCYRHDLPHNYVTKKKFSKLIEDIFEDNTINIKDYI